MPPAKRRPKAGPNADAEEVSKPSKLAKPAKPTKRESLAAKAKRGLTKKARASRKSTSTGTSAEDARRVPTQERSRKRLEKIVGVAAEAFASQGFDAAKMEAIAAEAGTSIGSVYQFFANKRALFGAVAERCLQHAREAFAARLSADAIKRPWNELLEEVVDTFASLHQRDPAFRAVMSNIQLYEDFALADQAMIEEFTETTAQVLGAWAPTIPTDRRVVIAGVVVNTIGGIMVTGSRYSNRSFDAMLVELKLMLTRYLAPELAPELDPGLAPETPRKL